MANTLVLDTQFLRSRREHIENSMLYQVFVSHPLLTAASAPLESDISY